MGEELEVGIIKVNYTKFSENKTTKILVSIHNIQ